MKDLEKFAADKDMVEGEKAFERFESLVGKVLTVPREEILRRDAEYKKTVHLRGKKRGPKPKNVSPVSAEGMDKTSEQQPEA